MDGSSGPGLDDEPPPEPRDGWLLVRIHVPELNIYKCLQFPSDRLIWDVKQQVLSSLPKELKESFNYGLFCPPSNGKAGKFLDEERRLGEYPFNGPVGYLELKYKRRVYKMLTLDERQLKALHTRANLRRFLECINGGHVEKITKMCAKGLDPNFHCPESGETPLAVATGCKKPNKILIALVNGGALLDYRTKDGTTALHRAVEKDSLEAVTTLLELGASPNYKDGKGITPLYVSITRKCDPKITETLLHDHATLGIQDTQGWNEVHQACRHGLIHHLEHLLFYGADMDAQNASGNTPLHVCAVNNQEACARMLLFRGAQRGALNFANQSPYQVAVIAGNLELAEIIQNYKSEEVVPFRGAPRYNPKRRSGINWINGSAGLNTGTLLNPITRNSLCVPHGPPSPCPSEHMPYSSASSSLSEGSSGHRSHEDDISFVTDKSLGEGSDIISDSSGVGTNSDSAACSIGHPSTTVVCMEHYVGNKPGHIRLQQGDIIEVVGSTDCGLLEGYVRGTNKSGFFPAECVQEVNMRQKSAHNNMGSGTATIKPSNQSSYQHSSTGSSVLQGSPQLSIGGSSGIGGSNSGTLPRPHHQPSPSLSLSNKGSNMTLNGNTTIICTEEQDNNENNIGQYSTATAPRIKKPTFNEPKTVVLHRAKRGFGFILRGAKASSQLMQLKPSERFPALQYLDDVDPGGVADMAGLRPGDFLLAINGTDVRSASHEKVVEMIRSAGALVSMTVISPQFPNQMQGTSQLIGNHHASSGPSTPQTIHRQCATLPRKMSMGPGAGGRMPAPLPPRRDPKTTLSVGRARAKSMVAGLENGGEKEENGVKQTKSSSVESIVVPTPTNPGTPVQLRTASIKARPTSNRITAAELEELFQRQQGETIDTCNKLSTMMTTSHFQTGTDSGCATPSANNTSPLKGPLVYGSVAEMKRKTKTKNGTLRGKPVGVPTIGGPEMKRFHSTPDLMAHANGSSSSIWTVAAKNHHSQDDVATLHTSLQRLNTLPPPSHPPPPPPVGQVVKVETRSSTSEYESTLSLQQKLKKRAENDAVTSAAIDGIQSSFNPSANAKIYASPQELRNVMAWKARQSQDLRQSNNNQQQKTIQQHPVPTSTAEMVDAPTVSANSQINPYAQPSAIKQNYLPPTEKSHYASTQAANCQIKNSVISNTNNSISSATVSAPPIPDPDYSLSESDGEDENSILVARNTKLNEKIAFIEVPETSGNSQTSGSSTSSTSISHSLSVEEIQRVRNNLKTSKSSPNGFHKTNDSKHPNNGEKVDEASKTNGEECDNSSSGVSSEQEVNASIILKPTDTIKKKPCVTIIEEPKTVPEEQQIQTESISNKTESSTISSNKTLTEKKEKIIKETNNVSTNNEVNLNKSTNQVEAYKASAASAAVNAPSSNTVTVKQLVQQQHAAVIQQQQQQMSGTKVKTMVIQSQQIPQKLQPNMAKRMTNSVTKNMANSTSAPQTSEYQQTNQKVTKTQQQQPQQQQQQQPNHHPQQQQQQQQSNQQLAQKQLQQQHQAHQQQLQQILKAKALNASGGGTSTNTTNIVVKQQQMLHKATGQNLQSSKFSGSIDLEHDQRSDDDGELSPSPPAKAFQRHNSLTRKQAAAIAMQRASRQSPSVLLTQLPPPLEAESDNEISFVGNSKSSNISQPCLQQVCPENIVLAPPPQFCDCNDIKHSSQMQQQPPLHHPPQQYIQQQRQPQILIIQQQQPHPQQQQQQLQLQQQQQQQQQHFSHPSQQAHMLMNMGNSSGNPTGTLGRVRIVSSIPKSNHHRNY